MAAQVLWCVTFHLSFPGNVRMPFITTHLNCLNTSRILHFLSNTYVSLSILFLKVKWCSSVFPDAVSIVCQLLTESLEGMDPSLSSCLETRLQDKDSQLQTLIDVKQVTKFSWTLKVIIPTEPLFIGHLTVRSIFFFNYCFVVGQNKCSWDYWLLYSA